MRLSGIRFLPTSFPPPKPLPFPMSPILLPICSSLLPIWAGKVWSPEAMGTRDCQNRHGAQTPLFSVSVCFLSKAQELRRLLFSDSGLPRGLLSSHQILQQLYQVDLDRSRFCGA